MMQNIEQQQQAKSNVCFYCSIFGIIVGFCLLLLFTIWYCSWFLLLLLFNIWYHSWILLVAAVQ
jgi:hypothetical protein